MLCSGTPAFVGDAGPAFLAELRLPNQRVKKQRFVSEGGGDEAELSSDMGGGLCGVGLVQILAMLKGSAARIVDMTVSFIRLKHDSMAVIAGVARGLTLCIALYRFMVQSNCGLASS